MKKTAGIRH